MFTFLKLKVVTFLREMHSVVNFGVIFLFLISTAWTHSFLALFSIPYGLFFGVFKQVFLPGI